jgi:hypothetical protein
MEWHSFWGTSDGAFNRSTGTFDVGSLKGRETGEVRVACYQV